MGKAENSDETWNLYIDGCGGLYLAWSFGVYGMTGIPLSGAALLSNNSSHQLRKQA